MKRCGILSIALALLLLTGCGARAQEEKFLAYQQELSQNQAMSFTANIRAEYEDQVQEYTLKFQKTPEESVTEIVAPELLAGIRARIKAGEVELQYDGAQLSAGALPGGLTPLSALPFLAEALEKGHLESAWREGEAAVFQITRSDDLSVTAWFDEKMDLYHAEIQSSGKVVVYCDIIT